MQEQIDWNKMGSWDWNTWEGNLNKDMRINPNPGGNYSGYGTNYGANATAGLASSSFRDAFKTKYGVDIGEGAADNFMKYGSTDSNTGLLAGMSTAGKEKPGFWGSLLGEGSAEDQYSASKVGGLALGAVGTIANLAMMPSQMGMLDQQIGALKDNRRYVAEDRAKLERRDRNIGSA